MKRKWTIWGAVLTLSAASIWIVVAVFMPNEVAEAKGGDVTLAQASANLGGANSASNHEDYLRAQLTKVQSGSAESGKFDSNADEIKGVLDTVAGGLARRPLANGQNAVTLNGSPLFTGTDAEWQFPVHLFKLSGEREAILMASSGGRGVSCETLFFFLIADRSSVKTTPQFGTCASQGSYSKEADRITITLPVMGGQSVYVLDGFTVTENGQVVEMIESNDPSK